MAGHQVWLEDLHLCPDRSTWLEAYVKNAFFGDFIKILYGSRNLKNKILELKNILKNC